jgi:hypothetical protein
MDGFRCEDIIAGCISTSSYVDGIDCCAKFFPSGSFASSTGACVTTYSAPPIIQVVLEFTPFFLDVFLFLMGVKVYSIPRIWFRRPCQRFTGCKRFVWS